MTNEEAIKVIGRIKAGEKLDSTKKLDAILCAMTTLEKSVPKRVSFFEWSDPYQGNILVPCCKSCSCGLDGAKYKPFCWNCGQALDWGCTLV